MPLTTLPCIMNDDDDSFDNDDDCAALASDDDDDNSDSDNVPVPTFQICFSIFHTALIKHLDLLCKGCFFYYGPILYAAFSMKTLKILNLGT